MLGPDDELEAAARAGVGRRRDEPAFDVFQDRRHALFLRNKRNRICQVARPTEGTAWVSHTGRMHRKRFKPSAPLAVWPSHVST
jgi:hypothetical protein